MRNSLCFIALSIVLLASAAAAGPLDSLRYYGIGVDVNQRRGILDFGGRIQRLNRNDLVAPVFLMGKRWKLNHSLRLDVAGTVSFGTAVDDTLPAVLFDDGLWAQTVLSTKIFHGGLIADIQFPFTVSPGSVWFFHAGMGGHAVSADEVETIYGEPRQEANTFYAEDPGLRFCVSGHAGLGVEMIVSQRLGIAVVHSMRYWRPIAYGMTRDLFPVTAIDYVERFLTNEFQLQFFFRDR